MNQDTQAFAAKTQARRKTLFDSVIECWPPTTIISLRLTRLLGLFTVFLEKKSAKALINALAEQGRMHRSPGSRTRTDAFPASAPNLYLLTEDKQPVYQTSETLS